MDLGDPIREHQVEPLVEPVPAESEPDPVRQDPVRQPDRDPVPA